MAGSHQPRVDGDRYLSAPDRGPTSVLPRRAGTAAASNQSAVRDRATLEHAADEADDAGQKDAEFLERLIRIEAAQR